MATPKFKIVRKLGNTALKLEEGKTFVLTLLSEFKTGAAADPAKGITQKGADTVRARNEETGDEVVVLANTTFRTTLEEAFPGGAYVNKTVQVTNRGRQNGKRYMKYDIDEVTLAK